MTTTIKSLTESQIKTLRREAVEAGDHMMGAICDLVLAGSVDADDYSVLSAKESRRLGEMSQDQAYAVIVEAINNGQG